MTHCTFADSSDKRFRAEGMENGEFSVDEENTRGEHFVSLCWPRLQFHVGLQLLGAAELTLVHRCSQQAVGQEEAVPCTL